MSEKRHYVNQPSARDSGGQRADSPSFENGRREDEARLARGLLLAVAQDLPHRLVEVDAARAFRGEIADLRHETHTDLGLGQDGRIDHERRPHALPGRPLRHVPLAGRVVPEPRDDGVGHLARHHHARRASVLHDGEDAAGPRGAGRGVLDGEATAAPRFLAVLDDDAALALGALARGLALLLELEDDLHLTAGLGYRRHRRREDDRDDQRALEAHAPYPGICASSGSLSQTGFHSGGWSPTDSALSFTSAAKAWRTSSLSRGLSRYLR